ncbi:MAG: hypothetical protein GQ564_22600 [Bacteroidales bacterium]|nr:hypothetical protein [Bacteroidales bacterium]
MYAQVKKPKENSFPTNRHESQAVANSVVHKKGDVKQGFMFIDNRPEALAQRKLKSIINTSHSNFNIATVAQLSDVVEKGVNDDDSLTQDKKVKTRNNGEAWFRFPIDSTKIDTFSDNKTKTTPKGGSHVSKTIEISDDQNANQYDIETLTRARHFGAGDRLIDIKKSDRKGKWTWHHKQNKYKMELVDMAVHRSFGHHGGFSAWQEDLDDTSDD